MDQTLKRLHLLLLPTAVTFCSLPFSMATSVAPGGCGSNVGSLYYSLCDLSAVWGIVLESFAAAGVVGSIILLIVLLASLPFITDKSKRSSVGLHACFLICTLGLFCLTFSFIVGKDFATCASRRFLFGVLFAGCFTCLLMQCVRLNLLARRGDQGPRAWVLCLGALGLWLVEVVINTEWLIITIVRYPLSPLNVTGTALGTAADVPCNIANQDFVMALIYVLNLLLAVVVASLPSLCGKHKQRRQEGAILLVTGLLSVFIWVAWITMYVWGNLRTGGPSWDDPTLAIALVSNAWVFLVLYTIPEICSLTQEDGGAPGFREDLHPSRGVGYETILKDQGAQNMFMENKAFSMDENSGPKVVSPYSGYSGQLRSSVYQPTELAIISKGMGNQEMSYESRIPRASINNSSPAHRGGSTLVMDYTRNPSGEHRLYVTPLSSRHFCSSILFKSVDSILLFSIGFLK
ncbi:G-protein coupled receptor family C group 5 member C isoform X1 [Oncorhynchus nerka]|uniref:G-protein coupled receptor family C group 5 member C isoform X1 n=1 Tax=Oncorhynchus nerka TaxID=8023 RepID=UPI001131080E|nr:G-protein coupled receptor family C group 5 member C-like isoform X1 [Oncorhynchus nerka]